MCERFVFGGQRSRSDMGDHEAGIDAAFGGEERRQAAEACVNQERDAPLGKRADLGDGERETVGRQRHRFGVEIAAGQTVPVFEDERVVGRRIGFDLECARHLAQDVEAGTEHLRLAADRIGILHARAIAVAGADAAVRHQRAQDAGGFDLSRLAARRVDARVERRVAAFHRIGRKRAGDEGCFEIGLRREQRRKRQRRRHLRAVQERKAFLGFELERREPGGRQRLTGRHGRAVQARAAFADEHGREVGKRREIARRADRAL